VVLVVLVVVVVMMSMMSVRLLIYDPFGMNSDWLC
jgi:hypothetical protein